MGSWLCFKLLWVDVHSILASPAATGLWAKPAMQWWLGIAFFERKKKHCGLPLWKACCPYHNLPSVSGQGLYTGQGSVLGCQPVITVLRHFSTSSQTGQSCHLNWVVCGTLTEDIVPCVATIVINKVQIKFLDVRPTSWIATALTAEWAFWRSMGGETGG